MICTTTSVDVGKGPVFPDAGIRHHAHINAVGSDFPGKIELPVSLLGRAFVCPDFPEQAIREGECQQLDTDQIGPSLAELVSETSRFESARNELSVFDSTGFALEDFVAMEIAIRHAKQFGLGQWIKLENECRNPYHPYECFQEAQLSRTG